MKCEKCGQENKLGDRFCKNCGNPLPFELKPKAPESKESKPKSSLLKVVAGIIGAAVIVYILILATSTGSSSVPWVFREEYAQEKQELSDNLSRQRSVIAALSREKSTEDKSETPKDTDTSDKSGDEETNSKTGEESSYTGEYKSGNYTALYDMKIRTGPGTNFEQSDSLKKDRTVYFDDFVYNEDSGSTWGLLLNGKYICVEDKDGKYMEAE